MRICHRQLSSAPDDSERDLTDLSLLLIAQTAKNNRETATTALLLLLLL